MDLKSMLNDSAAQRPPSLHTSHSSYDVRASESTIKSESHSRSQSHSHSQSTRPLPYPPPLQPVDSRHTSGGYFGNPSPHPNHLNSASTHASTPSVGPQSAYAKSPGGQSQPYTPRESAGPTSAYHNNTNNPSFIPSPSLPVNPPLTPGSAFPPQQYHTPHSAHPKSGHSSSYGQSQSPRGSNLQNGQPHQLTPSTPHAYSQPATPLGPPVNYNKNSPQAQRPPSQGLEHHYRNPSHGSTGSTHGREFIPISPQQQPHPQTHSNLQSHAQLHQHQPHHQHTPQQPLPSAVSVQRQIVPEIERAKERERSVSISPKTIPQPSPYRHMSVSSTTGSQGRPSIHSPPEARATSNVSDTQANTGYMGHDIKIEYQQTPTPRSSALPSMDQQQSLSRATSMKQESVESTSSPVKPPNLKRNASAMSDHSFISPKQPRKRFKRDDIPIFARSARTKPLRLGTGPKGGPQKAAQNRLSGTAHNQQPQSQPPPTLQSQQQQPDQPQHQRQHQPQPQPQPQLPVAQQQSQLPQHPHQKSASQPAQNGHPSTTNGRGDGPSISIQEQAVDFKWEASIANIAPFEDLTRRVCDWIYATIGSAIPPSGGAMFEIEAKIGEIFDIERGERLNLPVDTETVFNKQRYHGKTKFESSMNMEQHMLLNKYLNATTQEAFVQAQRGERTEILYDHPYEIDEFFELSQEGRQNLNPSILTYLKPNQRPRVRRTRDRQTGQLKAQIIKSRISDMEIYNPNTDFDCRISISIESPWDGNPDWLTPMGEGNEIRQKDRMSYRHMAYQVDLTQVSHENQPTMEHELEVEISTEQIRQELDNLQNNRPSKYEDLVRGLVDNVRLLCRKGSVGGARRG